MVWKLLMNRRLSDVKIRIALEMMGGDADAILETRRMLGSAYKADNMWDEAIACYKKLAEDAELKDDLSVMAVAKLKLGEIYEQLSDLDGALDIVSQAEELFAELGDTAGLSEIYRHRARY